MMKHLRSWLRSARQAIVAHPYRSAAILLVVAGGAWFFLLRGGSAEPAFETAQVERGSVVRIVSETGVVDAADEVDLAFTSSGRVASVPARKGSRVAAGQTLATIESGNQRAALASAQARLAEALSGTRPEELRIAEADVDAALSGAVDAVHEAFRAADDAVRTKTSELFHNPGSNPSLTFITDSANSKRAVEGARLPLERDLDAWERELADLSALSDLPAALSRGQDILGRVAPFLAALAAALNSAVADAYNTQTELDAYASGIASARAAIGTAQSGLTSARAALESAQKSLALSQAGSTSYDIAYEEAQVEAARAALANTVLVAPFSGLVTSLSATVGQIASPGEPVISLISDGAFEIAVEIPEDDIVGVAVGDHATVTLDALDGAAFDAVVVYVAPAASGVDGGVAFEVVLQFTGADERIRAGLTADVDIFADSRHDVITVPVRAVIDEDGARYVRAMEGEAAYRRIPVTVGLRGDGLYEITSGLSGGERIIIFANSAALAGLTDLGAAPQAPAAEDAPGF